jgi:hypothetical protein
MSGTSPMDTMPRRMEPHATTNERFRMRPDMRAIGKDYPSSSFKLFLFLTVAICVLMSGCGGSHSIWSAESRSPDGKVLAKARASATNGGLAILGSTDTKVYLKWATGSRTDTSVLELADASDAPVDTQVEMNWLTPSHLELVYKGNQTVVFQAIKWFGIDISVRDVSSGAVKSTQ